MIFGSKRLSSILRVFVIIAISRSVDARILLLKIDSESHTHGDSL